MEPFENELHSLRRAAPTAALDARMDELFARHAARDRAPGFLSRFGWLGTCLGVGGAVALVLFALHPGRPVHPAAAAPAIYRIEQAGQLRELLLEPSQPRRTAPRVFVRVTADSPISP